jgi:hypothetical protein
VAQFDQAGLWPLCEPYFHRSWPLVLALSGGVKHSEMAMWQMHCPWAPGKVAPEVGDGLLYSLSIRTRTRPSSILAALHFRSSWRGLRAAALQTPKNVPRSGHMADVARLSNSTRGVGPPYNEAVTLTALLVALVSADWTAWPSFKISTFKVPYVPCFWTLAVTTLMPATPSPPSL